jgi:hypothetical protein
VRLLPPGSRCGHRDTGELQVLSDEASVDGRVGQHRELAFVEKREHLGNLTKLALAEDGVLIFVGSDGSMGVVAVYRLDCHDHRYRS